MTKTITLHGQYPVRSQNPTVPAVAILSVDGVEHVVGRANTLSLLRGMKSAIYKLANLSQIDVPAREDQNPRKDYADLPALDGEFDVGPAFTVARRFELMRMAIDMTLESAIKSVILVGQGGLGKSHEVYGAVKGGDLEFTDPQIGEAIPGGMDSDDVVLVTGTSSPQGLYKTLANHRNQTIIFDDCDEVTKDALCFNLLKGVLDSKAVRRVSWVSAVLDKEGWETTINFTGQIIFISNRTADQFPQALQSRSLVINLTLSEKEIFERIDDIGSAPGNEWGTTPAEAKEIGAELYAARRTLKELSLRTYGKAAAFYKGKPDHWKDLIRFTL
jgi:hypothetical protein